MKFDLVLKEEAKEAAMEAFCAACAKPFAKKEELVYDILCNVVWLSEYAEDKTREIYMCGDKYGYDYFGRLEDDTLYLREVKEGKSNPIQIKFKSFEEGAKSLKYLFD